MPISIDAFENDEPLKEPSIGERVVAFLAANDDRAFKRGEIAEAIGAEANAVGSALTRLKDRNLVRHREQYWAITDDHERLRTAYDLHVLLDELATDEDEPFDREAWLADAVLIEKNDGNEDGNETRNG
jgi:Mn-dependent DtxR family transcriptional regulator